MAYDSRTDGKHLDNDKPWKYVDNTGWYMGKRANMKRYYKREARRANRRAAIPHTGMHGYGYGRDNYVYACN